MMIMMIIINSNICTIMRTKMFILLDYFYCFIFVDSVRNYRWFWPLCIPDNWKSILYQRSAGFIVFLTLTMSKKTCLSVVCDFNRVRDEFELQRDRYIYWELNLCLARFGSPERNFTGLLVHHTRISWRIK